MKKSISKNRKIIKVGNSQCVTLDQANLKKNGFNKGDVVDVKVSKK